MTQRVYGDRPDDDISVLKVEGVQYNTDNAKGKHYEDGKEFVNNSKPGDWFFFEGGDIYIHIPGVGRCQFNLNLDPEYSPPRWKWDGNREAPTITPSLHVVNHWHGWMKNGELISV